MLTLDEFKKNWKQDESESASPFYSHEAFEKIVNTRIKKQTKKSFQYFWAAFTLQVIVYSLLCHVMVKYWQQTEIVWFAIAGIFMYIPFTFMLLRKFKKLAVVKPGENGAASLHDYILQQLFVLRSFYSFKKWYELFLIPLSSALGVWLVFQLYVPGGVNQHWTGAIITFILTLAACIYAIYAENKKSFIQPIQQLQNVLDEFDNLFKENF